MEIKFVHPHRIKCLNKGVPGDGPVVYWMSRNQRAEDNWALLFALERARALRRSLAVVFLLMSGYKGGGESHFRFMLQGLEETAGKLERMKIPFLLLRGGKDYGRAEPAGKGGPVPAALMTADIGELIVDFGPLREKRALHSALAETLPIPVYEVDARNVVPVWTASDKQEYAARTIRPKILKLLPEYLEEFPLLTPPQQQGGLNKIGEALKPHRLTWKEAYSALSGLPGGPEFSWITPGEAGASSALGAFISSRLAGYSTDRNNPNLSATSMLSPYLHFGQLSAGRAALEVTRAAEETPGLWEAADGFLEELIVRRELSENFCYYNPLYDSTGAFPDWVKKTLAKHRRDPRQYIYALDELEYGRTHDDLWNAAQLRLITYGTMHGYLRMYWAKKILEWTRDPEQAMEYSLYLNDRYQLDGRDPNGYTGIAWALGGVHDRPWKEREIFGTLRYMNYNGCKRKFDVSLYINSGAPFIYKGEPNG